METNALEIRDPRQWLAAQGHSQAELDLLRRFICKDLSGAPPTDGELMFFMLYCSRHDLDPFSKQAHLLKTKTGPQICLGIDAMRIRAAKSQAYAGMDEPAFETDGEGKVTACKVVVHRLCGDRLVSFTGIAWMAESRGNSPIWTQRPRGMLEKCAEAKALRKAFPESLGGLYAPEEMEEHEKPLTAVQGINERLLAEAKPVLDVNQIQAEPAKDAIGAMLDAFDKIGISEGDVLDFCGALAVDEICEDRLGKLRQWYKQLNAQRKESPE